MQIFKNQSWATTWYVDAFAGTGRIASHPRTSSEAYDGETEEQEVRQFLDGSARVALSTSPPFDHFLFIERSRTKVKQLQDLRVEFPDVANRINVVQAEANSYLG